MKTVSKSVRKQAIRFALLVVQLVKCDGNIDVWETRYRKTWGRRKFDELLNVAVNRLDTVAKRLSDKKTAEAFESFRWTREVDRPYNATKRENLEALDKLRALGNSLKTSARSRFGDDSKLASFVVAYVDYAVEMAEKVSTDEPNRQPEPEAEPVERQAFELELQADGSAVAVKVDNSDNASGCIVCASLFDGKRSKTANLQTVFDASRRVDGPTPAPAYGAPANTFATTVKAIIITSALARFSAIIERFQNAKTSAELTAAVYDACRAVESVDGWERIPEAAIIDDEAERFASVLEESTDEPFVFPWLQAIAERITSAFSAFAVKALASA